MGQLVYSFNESIKDIRNQLGGKGATLAEMTEIGLPVPFGFIITNEACIKIYEEKTLDGEITRQIVSKLNELEKVWGKSFGDPENPLLISARCGRNLDKDSDNRTILNIGLNENIVRTMKDNGYSHQFVEEIYDSLKEMFKKAGGGELPQEPMEQLMSAIRHIVISGAECEGEFRAKKSWNQGLAVVIQGMVFGNIDEMSGAGFAFSRNPFTGGRELYGGFAVKTQGISVNKDTVSTETINLVEERFPAIYEQLETILTVLEKYYRNLQRVNFTISSGKLYILQARNVSGTATSEIALATDLVAEKMFSKEDALLKIKPSLIEQLLQPFFSYNKIPASFQKMVAWADGIRNLRIRANADKVEDVKKAVLLGAEGIGLCRTEGMFWEPERFLVMNKMIFADNADERDIYLEEIFKFQKKDFKEMYRVLEDKPVTIRLMDLPLKNFIPKTDEEIEKLARSLGRDIEFVRGKITRLKEQDPMMGRRGCRLGISHPEIPKAQIRAIVEGAIEVKEETGVDIAPEIMVPMISSVDELAVFRGIIDDAAVQVMSEKGVKIDYLVGTMIEVPRAALTADKIAKYADFFSFGTNDLTQMVYGMSVNDSKGTIKEYIEKDIFHENPFEVLDVEGVGQLMKHAISLGRQEKSNLKIGISGIHAEDSQSIEFCHKIGINYISCRPAKIPAAKISAAQAAIHFKRRDS